MKKYPGAQINKNEIPLDAVQAKADVKNSNSELSIYGPQSEKTCLGGCQ